MRISASEYDERFDSKLVMLAENSNTLTRTILPAQSAE
jgi:hypothetical protein